MNTCATVGWAINQSLTIGTIHLEGLRPGEMPVDVMVTGICYTNAYTESRLGLERLLPAILGHEGAGIACELGAGVASDHVTPLYTPECRQCNTCLCSTLICAQASAPIRAAV